MRRLPTFVSIVAFAAFTAVSLVTITTAIAQSPGARSAGAGGRPPPPPIPARVVSSRCSYGGAVPAIFVTLELEATSSVSGLSAATLYLHTASGRMLSGVRGAMTIRLRSASAPGVPASPPAPFDGHIAAGQRIQLEVFGMLETAAFGRARYPNAELPFELALTSGPAVLRVRGGPCRITPAG